MYNFRIRMIDLKRDSFSFEIYLLDKIRMTTSITAIFFMKLTNKAHFIMSNSIEKKSINLSV